MTLRSTYSKPPELRFARKIREVNWLLVLLVTAVAGIGFTMLYSAADGSFDPWASRQMVRFSVGLIMMLAIALVDLRFWLRYAYAFYGAALLLLIAVEVMGDIGMGARRWLDLGPFQLQPSEVMKIALVLALARFFHGVALEDIGRLRTVLPPLVMVVGPVALVLRQPDLGTALLLLMVGGAIFFVAGVRLWKFGLALLLANHRHTDRLALPA